MPSLNGSVKEMGQDSSDIQAGFERLNTARRGAQEGPPLGWKSSWKCRTVFFCSSHTRPGYLT